MTGRIGSVARTLIGLLALVCGVVVGGLAGTTVGAGAAPAVQVRTPLDGYVGFGTAFVDQDEAQFEAEEGLRQNLIKSCMAESGFDHSTTMPVTVDLSDPEFDDKSIDQVFSELEAIQDPNLEYVAGLSPADQEAYWISLYGVTDPAEQESALLDESRIPAGGSPPDRSVAELFGIGCDADARRSVPGVYAAKAELTREVSELRTAIAQDPRSVSLYADWAGCMNQRGYSGATWTEVHDQLEQSHSSAPSGSLETDKISASDEFGTHSTTCLNPVRDGLLRVQIEHEEAFVKAHAHLLKPR